MSSLKIPRYLIRPGPTPTDRVGSVVIDVIETGRFRAFPAGVLAGNARNRPVSITSVTTLPTLSVGVGPGRIKYRGIFKLDINPHAEFARRLPPLYFLPTPPPTTL